MEYNINQHIKLLKYEQILKNDKKLLKAEDSLKYSELQKLTMIVVDYLHWCKKKKYFSLLINFLDGRIGEFFGEGNILLCNKEKKILALQHSIDVRHRKLSVGLEYTQPPSGELDIFNIKESDFNELKTTDLVAAKWFGRTLGLPKKYVEAVFEIAKVDGKKIGNGTVGSITKKMMDEYTDVVMNKNEDYSQWLTSVY